MSPKNAIIILIIIAVCGALFFVYLYYNQQLAISPANKIDSSFTNQINKDTGTTSEQLTKEERMQELFQAMAEVEKINPSPNPENESEQARQERMQELFQAMAEVEKINPSQD
jgi:hypothetical protein